MKSTASATSFGCIRLPEASASSIFAFGQSLTFPNISAYLGKSVGSTQITDAVTFSAALLEQSHVAVVPGNDSGFDTHVRLSFATSMEQIDKGIDRIAEFLKKIQ